MTVEKMGAWTITHDGHLLQVEYDEKKVKAPPVNKHLLLLDLRRYPVEEG